MTKHDSAETLPAGEYAIVEIFGHVTLVGKIGEVERFGAKMLMVEPLYAGDLLDPVYYGGGAIYGLTPCSAAIAWKRQPAHAYELPSALRAALAPAALPAPETDIDGEYVAEGDEE
jgi:hypothetical protein